MKHYTFVDYATQGYISVVGLLILFFHNATVPAWRLLLAAHAGCLAAVHLLILAQARWPANRVLTFLRHFYPVLLYTGFYRETGALNRMFVSDYQDAHFIWLEEWLFGGQACIQFMDSWPYLIVSEVLYAAYFSYYLMIAGIGITLFFKNRQEFYHYVTVVSFVFYLCYLTYICLPVMGPRAFFREIDGFRLPDEIQAYAGAPTYPDRVKEGMFYQLMGWIYRNFEGPGAAFPSSHVAIALCTAWFSFLYLRRIRYVHLTVALLLCAATVYCRYHYVVDVIAGSLTTCLLVPLGNRLYRLYGQKPEPARVHT